MLNWPNDKYFSANSGPQRVS